MWEKIKGGIKNEWPKSVDGEWCACKEAESNIEKEDYNE